ncbi:hypothetical protein HWC09_gp021 [Lactobacillus phage 3-521]|uniref:Uncharacterized protein n=1 Tax=Lactobacillus phage 3-521 TaxID=2510943 RepID=A0A4Y5FEP4_9CAUD|nr:hypothetical protein HWC09_gp021 [Lactobacillus phage 3-521]QBJ03559.1 hypothetical protein UCC3521_0021 [Lactobacillus phage 3-521]
MNKENDKELQEFTKALTKAYNRNPKKWNEISERLKRENKKKYPAFIAKLKKRIKENGGNKHE